MYCSCSKICTRSHLRQLKFQNFPGGGGGGGMPPDPPRRLGAKLPVIVVTNIAIYSQCIYSGPPKYFFLKPPLGVRNHVKCVKMIESDEP